jgi:hypothetical protein
VLATHQEAVGLRPDGKPKKVDEGAAAFKKDLTAAEHGELSKRWKALSLEQKEPFEERARKEKEAVLKEAQAAAKRLASSGEGGHGKLREQIEAFGTKQPAAFVALFERLAADDLAVAARLEKQTARDKQREAKEAEALRKLRYPIADELLANEPPHEPPLAEWPEPRYAINLPPEAQPCVGSLLAAFDFVSTYADPLGLTRFSLEELRLALLHRGPSVLLSEMALALLRFCLPEDPSSPDEGAKVRVQAGLAGQAGAELTAAGLPCRGAPTRGVLTEASWVEVARWVLVRQAEGNDDPTMMRALEAMRATELWRLPLEQKLVVLLALIEAASASDAMRAVLSEHLERYSEALGAQREKEKEEREKENERRAAARALKEEKARAAAAAAAEAGAEGEGGGEEATAGAKAGKKRKRPSKGADKGGASAEAADGSAEGANADEGSGCAGSDDAVLPPPPEELEPPDDSAAVAAAASASGGGGGGGGGGVKGHASDRVKAKELADSYAKAVALHNKREKASAKLREAIAAEELPQLQEALKLASQARMEGRHKDGRPWRFEVLSEALMLVTLLESREQQVEVQRARRAQAQAYAVRREPLGIDRYGRRYWRFPSGSVGQSEIFVEWRAPPAAPPPPGAKLKSAAAAEAEVTAEDEAAAAGEGAEKASGGATGGKHRQQLGGMMHDPMQMAQPVLAQSQPMLISVQVPPGMMGGMVLQVQTPAGLVQVQIPQGLFPGQTFQMQVPMPARPPVPPVLAEAPPLHLGITIPEGFTPGMPLDMLVPDGRRVRVLVPPGMHPGMQLQVALPPHAPPMANGCTGVSAIEEASGSASGGKRGRARSPAVTAALAKPRKLSKKDAAAKAAAEAAEAEAAEAAAEALRRRAAPSTTPSRWRCYRSRAEVLQLAASLDERGVRELALKRNLEAEMAVLQLELAAEPPPPRVREADGWVRHGPHVGQRVRLVFPNNGESEGSVTAYLPPDGADQALWHIEHDDGDEEDLEEHELQPALERWRERPADGLMQLSGLLCDAYVNEALKPKQRVQRILLGPAAVRAELLMLQEEAVKAMEAAQVAWASAKGEVKSEGGEGGSAEAATTSAASWPPMTKTASAASWRAAVEQPGTLEGEGAVGSCGALLLELEARLRQIQAAEDLSRVADESEGKDGEEIFQCDRCDFESTSYEVVIAHEQTCAAGQQEDVGDGSSKPEPEPEEPPPKAKGKGGKGGKGGKSKVEAETPPPPPPPAPAPPPPDEMRLWPSREARQQWRAYVGGASSFSQLALAASNLRDHAAAFGALGKKVDASARAAAARRCEHVWDVLPPVEGT